MPGGDGDGRERSARPTVGMAVTATPPAVRRMVVISVVVLLLALVAAPARAHGPTPDGSNFRSRVAGTVRMVGGEPAGPADMRGVTWRVLGADALLQVHNAGEADVVVLGYEGEPFLRVGAAGVFENRRSPATYFNADRFGTTQVPPRADAKAAPDWHKVSDGRQWQWHDHRIHWMAQDDPPAVARAPDDVHTVLEWTVPFRVSGRDMAVHGALRWIPPGPVWPWLTGAAAFMALPVLVQKARRGGERPMIRVVVALVALVALACVVVAVGDAAATPAGLVANAWAVAQTVLPAAVAVALAGSLWRHAPDTDVREAATSLLVATCILAVGCGVVRLTELRASQIVTALPPWAVRATVAASLAVVMPAMLMALFARRGEPAR